MRRFAAKILVATSLVAGPMVFLDPAGPALANHNGCFPAATGDSAASWPSHCREFIVDSGHGNLLSRAGLIARSSLYTSNVARFSSNFLWYSHKRTVTITDPSVEWSGCRGVPPGAGNACATNLVVADNYGLPHLPGRGSVLDAFHDAPSITLSVFEFDGVWIARACGNWIDVAKRTDPIPYLDGHKFRDDNRNGNWDAGEPPISGWSIRISRQSSEVGQSAGALETVTTDPNGYYRFDLNGHGPGVYRVEEVVPAGWANYTPAAYDVTVEFGHGARQYRRDFGNAQTTADVAKTNLSVVSAPAHFDAGVTGEVTVSVTVENFGPAELVPVSDTLDLVFLSPDCVAPDRRRSFTATLRRAQPVTRTFTYQITCSRPSNHDFRFDDVLSITRDDVTDPTPSNNSRSTERRIPVHAYTDLAVTASVVCPPRTNVGIGALCESTYTATNTGFDDIDATVEVAQRVPSDCTASPATSNFAMNFGDGETITRKVPFTLTCDDRSFHDVSTTAVIDAVDPHVFDTNAANDTATSATDTIEVFHNAAMAATNLYLTCDERIGDLTFSCTAVVTYSKSGPAPSVLSEVWASLAPVPGCAVAPAARQNIEVVLDDDLDHTASFTWNLTCATSANLHPTKVEADINPILDRGDPHPVDTPGPITDRWTVPYCTPTVNPHGKTQPQAPGQGMNEDGFYEFGTLPGFAAETVRIRDTGSGYVFGPFRTGVRIKWVEANGAHPSIRPMGGNNGSGGAATAVDYQIRARGDAQAFYVDERGREVSVICLVPPFPK